MRVEQIRQLAVGNSPGSPNAHWKDRLYLVFLLLTLDTGPSRRLSLELIDTKIYQPAIRARLGWIGGWEEQLTRPPWRQPRGKS